MNHEIAFEMATSSVRYGVGVTREVGMDLADLGVKNALVVMDPVVGKLPTGDVVRNSLDAVIANSDANTKILPGHGPVVDRAAVVAHREVVIAARDKVAALVREGKTQEQVIAAKPLAELDARVQQVATTGDRFVGQLYAELKK